MAHFRKCQKEKGFLASFLFNKPTREELVRKGDLPSLARLLRKQGPEKFLNAPLDGDGNTPLIIAAGRGSYRVVQWLVSQKGINLNARNRYAGENGRGGELRTWGGGNLHAALCLLGDPGGTGTLDLRAPT